MILPLCLESSTYCVVVSGAQNRPRSVRAERPCVCPSTYVGLCDHRVVPETLNVNDVVPLNSATTHTHGKRQMKVRCKCTAASGAHMANERLCSMKPWSLSSATARNTPLLDSQKLDIIPDQSNNATAVQSNVISLHVLWTFCGTMHHCHRSIFHSVHSQLHISCLSMRCGPPEFMSRLSH